MVGLADSVILVWRLNLINWDDRFNLHKIEQELGIEI
jgi:hypothetical protein